MVVATPALAKTIAQLRPIRPAPITLACFTILAAGSPSESPSDEGALVEAFISQGLLHLCCWPHRGGLLEIFWDPFPCTSGKRGKSSASGLVHPVPDLCRERLPAVPARPP